MTVTTIIVGAGSAGCALAARLSEDADQHVVLVEAGPDYPKVEDVPWDLRNPGEMSTVDHDWGLRAYFVEPPEAKPKQPYPRGCVVGGSSSVNHSIAQRACVEDFDAWVAAGNHEWSWDQVLPYFERLESDLDFGDRPGHGDSGPIPIVRHPMDQWHPATVAFRQAALDRGFPPADDTNEPGGTGVGPAARNIVDGIRASGLVTYVREARDRPNLTIISDARCRRVLFDGNRATGVEIDRAGHVRELSADRVVLAAGTIHSPQILTLSGIGPAATLDRLGIEPVAISEGVGREFRDHPMAPVLLLMPHTDMTGNRAVLKYTTAGGAAAGLVDDIMMYPVISDVGTLNLPVETGDRTALTLMSVLAKPRSVGWLDIVSTDPAVQPELHLNYLSDPGDVDRLIEAVRLAYEFASTEHVAAVTDEIVIPDRQTIEDDERLRTWLLEIATTAYHATSTCRMGPDGDEGAVVDQRLRVRGTEGLFVADASVMYSVPTGLTNLASFMIGERMADWLRQSTSSATADLSSAS